MSRPQGVKRCLTCFYVLDGLQGVDGPRCPECGRGFDPRNAATYTTRPPFVWWRVWLPGLLLATALGFCTSGALVGLGSFGYGLTIGVPLSIGAIVGYRVRARLATLPFVALAAIIVVVTAMIAGDFSGLFCGAVLATAFLVPTLTGVLLGWSLKLLLKNANYEQAAWLPIAIIALLPLAVAAIEGRAAPIAPVRLSTTERLDATPAEAWSTLMFYEEVERRPPLLLRLGLPNPLRTTGSMSAVGDVKVCLYDKGRLTKVIVESRPPDRLAFVVTEQDIGFERSVRLIGGSFQLEATPGGGTLITLTTEYEPLLAARFMWGPPERLAVHTLHRHVLAGMRDELPRVVVAANVDRAAHEDPRR